MATEPTEQLTAQIGKLFSREEQKLIPIFKGQVEVTNGRDWLHEADRIGVSPRQNRKWGARSKSRFFFLQKFTLVVLTNQISNFIEFG